MNYVAVIRSELANAFATSTPRRLEHAGVLDAVAAFQGLFCAVHARTLVHVSRNDAATVLV